MKILTTEEIEDLKENIQNLIHCQTKAEGKLLAQKLRFKSDNLANRIDPYNKGKLDEAISYALEASGQVKNKEHWAEQSSRSWYLFESNLKFVGKNKS